RDRGAERGETGRRLPRGHAHPRPGSVAHAGKDRRRATGDGNGCTGHSDRPLGSPQGAGPVQEIREGAAADDRAGGGRPSGGPFPIRRAVGGLRDPPRDHGGHPSRYGGAAGESTRGNPARPTIFVGRESVTVRPPRIAVLGAGSWGTTFAKVIADAGHGATLWARRQAVADEINSSHRNSFYLPDILLPASIGATSDIAEALDGADIIVLSIPAQSLRERLTEWRSLFGDDAVLVSLMK